LNSISTSTVTMNQLTQASKLCHGSLPLSTQCTDLNKFFDGGLHWGELIEWGIPWGLGGRQVPLHFLAAAHRMPGNRPLWCLWVHNRKPLQVYPPALAAKGIHLDFLRFACSEKPIHELKAVFTESLFKLIILDGVTSINRDDCAFLSQMARKHHMSIMLLRDQLLNPDSGNVWARRRLNCWHDPFSMEYHLEGIKGFPINRMNIRL